MGIIINQSDTMISSSQLKSSSCAAECLKPSANAFCVCAAHIGSNKCGKGIQNIMITRNGKNNMWNKFSVMINIVFRSEAAGHINVFCRPFAVVWCSEGNKRFSLYAFQHINRVFVIAVIKDGFCCVFTESAERFFYGFKISEEIQVVLINIQHNRHICVHMQKSVVEFTGFANKILAVSVSSVCIYYRKPAADNCTWVKPCFKKNLCCHGRNGCFSVCSANTDTVGENSADCTQNFGSFKCRQIGFCIFKLFISCQNCVGVNYKLNIFRNILLYLSKINFSAFLFNLSEGFRIVIVRAGNPVTEWKHNFGNRAHACTADSYKMYSFHLFKQIIYGIQKQSLQNHFLVLYYDFK